MYTYKTSEERPEDEEIWSGVLQRDDDAGTETGDPSSASRGGSVEASGGAAVATSFDDVRPVLIPSPVPVWTRDATTAVGSIGGGRGETN